MHETRHRIVKASMQIKQIGYNAPKERYAEADRSA